MSTDHTIIDTMFVYISNVFIAAVRIRNRPSKHKAPTLEKGQNSYPQWIEFTLQSNVIRCMVNEVAGFTPFVNTSINNRNQLN